MVPDRPPITGPMRKIRDAQGIATEPITAVPSVCDPVERASEHSFPASDPPASGSPAVAGAGT
jgi:hypothetical protein